MFNDFEELTNEQMNTIYGGTQTVDDIDRTQPNK